MASPCGKKAAIKKLRLAVAKNSSFLSSPFAHLLWCNLTAASYVFSPPSNGLTPKYKKLESEAYTTSTVQMPWRSFQFHKIFREEKRFNNGESDTDNLAQDILFESLLISPAFSIQATLYTF